ncbi:MAG: hypothetical protein AAGA48_03585 [Myxococcota bacterium]
MIRAGTRVLPPQSDNAGWVSVTLEVPWDTGRPIHPRDLLIAVDTAQDASELAVSVAAAQELLAGLGPKDRFDLVEVGRYPRPDRPKFRAASPKLIAQAKEWLKGLRPNHVCQQSPFVRTLEAWKPSRRLRLVVLLTDGELRNWETVCERLDGAPFVALATDPTLDHGAVRALAAVSGGEVVVHSGDAAESTRRLVRRIARPVVVDWAFANPNTEVWTHSTIPELFAGYPVHLQALYRPGSHPPEVRLVGRGVASTIEVQRPLGGEPAPGILTARNLRYYLSMHDDGSHNARQGKYALKLRLSTRHTPLVPSSTGPTACGVPLGVTMRPIYPGSWFYRSDPYRMMDVSVSPPWVRGPLARDDVAKAIALAPRMCLQDAQPDSTSGIAGLHLILGAGGVVDRFDVDWLRAPRERQARLKECLVSTIPARVATLGNTPVEIRALLTFSRP